MRHGHVYIIFCIPTVIQSKLECKDQESIQSSPTPDPVYLKSEVRPTGVQLKRKAKLSIVMGLTIKHAVCCNTLML